MPDGGLGYRASRHGGDVDPRRLLAVSLALLALALLVPARGQRHEAASAPPSSVATATTRTAATVSPGYQPPADRVPTTGAYLPANGKPTLVFVDAIW